MTNLTNTLTNLVKVRNLAAMTRQVNIYEAKTQLSRLVEEAAGGGVIVIAKDGKPRAKLVAIDHDTTKKEPRKLGQWDQANKNFDWAKWERASKAADKEIERLFNEGDGPSALDELAPKSKRRKVPGFAERKSPYVAKRKRRTRG